jgi:ketosteroid isomerase-like protein
MEEWRQCIGGLKAAYEAWDRSKATSIDHWLPLFADVVDFRSLAQGGHGVPWTRQRSTPNEVRAYLEGLTGTFRMLHYTVDRYVCQGDTIVVVGRTGWIHRASERRLETPIVSVWRFKDGKAIEFFEYYDTAAVAAAAA